MFIFTLNSCGLKITTEVSENLLLGDWKLDKLKCYNPNSAAYIEDYNITDEANLDVGLEIESNSFQYSVASSCTTTAFGSYKTKFDGSRTGNVEFYDVVSGNTCDVAVPFLGNGSAGGIGTVNFALLPTKSKSLTWEMGSTNNTFYLRFFTNFSGSNDASYCQSGCECFGEFVKD